MTETNLLDYLLLLNRRRKLIIQVVIFCTLVVLVISLLLPKKYRAEAVILPLASKAGGASALASSMSGGIGSLLDIGGGNSQSNQLMVLLKSRSLAERVIEKMNLIPILGNGKNIPMQVAVSKLSDQLEFGEDKKQSTVTIAAQAHSPQLAVDIVNTFLNELRSFIQASAFTQAKHYRLYLENQVAKNKEAFLETGNELNSFYKDGRISNVESKIVITDDDIPETAKSNGPKAFLPEMTKETFGNVDMDGTSPNDTLEDISTPNVKKVPQQVYLQYLTLRHEILAKMSAVTAQQLELAKMEEAKDELKFQVVDPAIIPLTKCWPKRSEMVLTAFLTSLLFMCLGIIVYDRSELTKPKTLE